MPQIYVTRLGGSKGGRIQSPHLKWKIIIMAVANMHKNMLVEVRFLLFCLKICVKTCLSCALLELTERLRAMSTNEALGKLK